MSRYEGFPVSLDMLPVEARAFLSSSLTPAQLQIRLNEGGTVEFKGAAASLTLGTGPNYSSSFTAFIACDRFALLDGANITTNGNNLVILCNTFESDNAKIQSFKPEQVKAMRGADGSSAGAPGGPGVTGDFGGLVSIHVIEDLIGILHIDLSGQEGGDGGSGIQGAQGNPGPNGADSHSDVRFVGGFLPVPVPYCAREAQPGHPGGTGNPGGTGGNGGAGGLGGIFELYNVGAEPIGNPAFTFKASGGVGGQGGAGGAGGPGGNGGAGGAGGFSCHGANPGPQGATGSRGVDGVNGQNGAEGSSVVQNLDLQVLINSVVRKQQ